MFLGDGAVGKTMLLMTYIHKKYPDSNAYIPTVIDNYYTTVGFRGGKLNLEVWDTAGRGLYEELLHKTLVKTDVIIICYSCSCSESFLNAKNYWIKGLRKNVGPKTPFILVGTKKDLKGESDFCVDTEEGLRVAKQTKAYEFIECSALWQSSFPEKSNVNKVFETAISAAYIHQYEQKSSCGTCL